jgi:ribosome biogenesis GTPase
MTEGLIEGIVTRGHGNRFVVYAGGCHYSCQMRKKIKFKTEQTTPVAVGDDVLLTVIDDKEAVIEEVRDRRSVLSRPAVGQETIEHVLAANIDVLIAVASAKEPDIKPGLIDRFLIAAGAGGLKPAIVINKIDLGLEDEAAEAAGVYRQLDYNLFLTSAVDGRGLDEFAHFLKNHHSGVGKSTILNRLLPGVELPTREISQSTGRGRHTTSHIELFRLPQGGFIIDSPGLKVIGLWQVDRDELASFYPEIAALEDACRFPHCSHIHEPDCAVRDAVDKGDVAPMRYRNYVQIYESLCSQNRVRRQRNRPSGPT